MEDTYLFRHLYVQMIHSITKETAIRTFSSYRQYTSDTADSLHEPLVEHTTFSTALVMSMLFIQTLL
jgi:hypothetical protein